MTEIYNTQLLSGLAVQHQYNLTASSGIKTSGQQPWSTHRLFVDTVDISSEAWALFRNQISDSGTSTQATTSTGNQSTNVGNDMGATGATAITKDKGNTVSDRIEAVESEISGLESDIASLEEQAQTDDIAAVLLRSKQARLSVLEAMLTGLVAESLQYS